MIVRPTGKAPTAPSTRASATTVPLWEGLVMTVLTRANANQVTPVQRVRYKAAAAATMAHAYYMVPASTAPVITDG